MTAELHRTIGFRGASVVEGADGRRIGWEVQLSTVDERGLREVRARTGKAAKNGITPAWHTDQVACSQRNDAHRPRSDRLSAHVVARNGDLRIVSGFRARSFRHCDTSALHPCPNGIRRCGKVHATAKPRDVFSDDMVRQTAAGTVVPIQFRAGTSVHRYWVTQRQPRPPGGPGQRRHAPAPERETTPATAVGASSTAGVLTDPAPVVVEDVAERLARSLRSDDGTRSVGPAPDHLEGWLAVRESVPWQEVSEDSRDDPVSPSRDGAAEDIRAFDGALDPARARGLLAALELLRADAARGACLDFELLQRWQQHVLGTSQPPPFRDLPAFAKAGRERYGIGPDTRARLDACLAESARQIERPLPLIVRAARAYLDVCFFHPFDDGNARSALLTLVFVLAREGVALDGVSLLLRVTFQADEPQDALALTRYVDIHLSETRRNTAASLDS
ncbi:Fic family protein [Streptomyces albogriseolus]|uniref:Fic family protein n=1 Tax=Streptomyces albogriseolus TaxID=1887 RepID=UPI00367F5316